MHCRMLADMSWLSCVSRCFLASIFPTRATVLCMTAHLREEAQEESVCSTRC